MQINRTNSIVFRQLGVSSAKAWLSLFLFICINRVKSDAWNRSRVHKDRVGGGGSLGGIYKPTNLSHTTRNMMLWTLSNKFFGFLGMCTSQRRFACNTNLYWGTKISIPKTLFKVLARLAPHLVCPSPPQVKVVSRSLWVQQVPYIE